MTVIHISEWKARHAIATVALDAESSFSLACTLEESQLYRAEQLYKYAASAGHVGAMVNLGSLKFRAGHSSAAEKLYRAALRIDATHPEANYNLGHILFERSKYRLALSYLLRAIASDPTFADAHFNAAECYRALGLPLRAWPHWQRYLLLDTNPYSQWRSLARNALRALGVCDGN